MVQQNVVLLVLSYFNNFRVFCESRKSADRQVNMWVVGPERRWPYFEQRKNLTGMNYAVFSRM